MTRFSQVPLAAGLMLTMAFTACSKPSKVTPAKNNPDKVIMVDDDDPEMNAAISTARSTLPQFWETFDKPGHGETNFSLKVLIRDHEEGEYFWVIDLQRKNGKIMGTINNDPEIVSNVKMGDRMEIPEADIADWLYMRDGKMFGNETLKPLLKKMPAEEAARFRKMMAAP